ncbi:hypothetical protein ACQKHG_24820, partial [Escherichia coli]|uniref:hypothetical protein n=1 Tax=Escherichia coli TaxID=562 RepID=UPI003CFEFA58
LNESITFALCNESLLRNWNEKKELGIPFIAQIIIDAVMKNNSLNIVRFTLMHVPDEFCEYWKTLPDQIKTNFIDKVL